ncbi:MAG: hypothetical protein WBB81_09175, partial [Pyrinomonadaceae bacterium]
MNRNNIWIHIGIAVVLITMAAVLGQIGRWKESLHDRSDAVQKRVETIKADQIGANTAPEVLVRFKPGVSLSQIRSIATANHDALTDEIESVSGLAVIDDLDNADAQTVANQYAARSDTVAYAEVN